MSLHSFYLSAWVQEPCDAVKERWDRLLNINHVRPNNNVKVAKTLQQCIHMHCIAPAQLSQPQPLHHNQATTQGPLQNEFSYQSLGLPFFLPCKKTAAYRLSPGVQADIGFHEGQCFGAAIRGSRHPAVPQSCKGHQGIAAAANFQHSRS
jgi:hypothetical protein